MIYFDSRHSSVCRAVRPQFAFRCLRSGGPREESKSLSEMANLRQEVPTFRIRLPLGQVLTSEVVSVAVKVTLVLSEFECMMREYTKENRLQRAASGDRPRKTGQRKPNVRPMKL